MPGRFGRGPGQKKGKWFRGGRWLGWSKQQRRSIPQCICPGCGLKITKKPGVGCYKTICPQCGSLMMRQFASEK